MGTSCSTWGMRSAAAKITSRLQADRSTRTITSTITSTSTSTSTITNIHLRGRPKASSQQTKGYLTKPVGGGETTRWKISLSYCQQQQQRRRTSHTPRTALFFAATSLTAAVVTAAAYSPATSTTGIAVSSLSLSLSLSSLHLLSSSSLEYTYCQEEEDNATTTSTTGTTSTTNNHPSLSSNSKHYRGHDNDTKTIDDNHHDDNDIAVMTSPRFPETALTLDHYNGITLDVSKLGLLSLLHPNDDSSSSGSGNKVDDNDHNENELQIANKFGNDLLEAMKFWKAEGRKGIWIHIPLEYSLFVPQFVKAGFQFHFVKEQQQQEKVLVLSQWLSKDGSPSRLPHGPTHQVGVGIVILKQDDPTQMLVVQELTGPAAAYQLWKMPTGLLDPNEDIPDAASRELKEETGLDANFQGIVCFRQAHSTSPTRPPSDLFFVCHMTLIDPNQDWNLQPEEIADIRWMFVDDYCAQEQWQRSPVYQTLNDCIRKLALSLQQQQQQQQQQPAKDPENQQPSMSQGPSSSSNGLILHKQLPLGFSTSPRTTTNAVFHT